MNTADVEPEGTPPCAFRPSKYPFRAGTLYGTRLHLEPWGLRPLKPSPDPSESRLRRVEFMLHALRGAMGIRTPDLLNAIEALYQLSYDPETSNLIAAFSVSQGKPLACGVSSG